MRKSQAQMSISQLECDQNGRRRRGLTLIELIIVTTLLGILASAAMMRISRGTLGDAGARFEARTLSLALLQAQRAAIRTGDRHGISFHGPGSNVHSWSVVRSAIEGNISDVDGPHWVPSEVKLKTDASQVWFDFEGGGTDSFDATFRGSNRTFKVHVEPLTRMITTEELK